MNVKGTAYLARKLLLEKEIGEVQAKAALDAVLANVPSFPQPILASTTIPMASFLAFQEELMRQCYAGDSMSFFRFGEASADWALTKGPYKRLTEEKDLDGFAVSGAALYRTYFDVGSARTSLKIDHVEYRLDGIPKEFRTLTSSTPRSVISSAAWSWSVRRTSRPNAFADFRAVTPMCCMGFISSV
ncbi:MAG: hypothetical protein ABI461_10930, partial [Polyangiaceae bacterium]